jgi:hypothetical protein
LEHEQYVDSAVADLVASGAVRACHASDLTVVSPLNVVTRAGSAKLRLILDLSYVNSHLHIPSFKYEGLHHVHLLAAQGDLMFSVDLAAGFHHVSMHPSAWPYMGFAWRGLHYCFVVLPFGLATAPWCFTKVMKVVVQDIRSKGLSVIPYLDDFWCSVSHLIPAHQQLFRRDLALRIFTEAGLNLQLSKCILELSARLPSHLGYAVDTAAGVFEVSEARWDRMQACVSAVMRSGRRIPVRLLMRVTGHLASMRLALGSAISLFSRAMYSAIGQHSPVHYVPCTPELTEELRFWSTLSRTAFTGTIWRVYTVLDITISTDAGGKSWGGVCGEHRAQGFFTDQQRACSSTQRELWAAAATLQSFQHLMHGRSVLLQTDSWNAQQCIISGSRTEGHQQVALQIFWIMRGVGASLQVQWVPRSANSQADAITRWEDSDDLRLHPHLFAQLEAAWGPHTIDRFASHTNHLLPAFNSYMWCPATAGVDAFAQRDWAAHNNWCHPPTNLVGHTVAIILEQRATATLVAPLWRAAPWWPSLVAIGGQHFRSFVQACQLLPTSRTMFLPGPSTAHSAVARWGPTWQVMALRISGQPSAAAALPIRVPV